MSIHYYPQCEGRDLVVTGHVIPHQSVSEWTPIYSFGGE